MSVDAIILLPIGFVSSPRVDTSDDNWGAVESIITIDSLGLLDDALLELNAFSHIEVIYRLHRAPLEEIEHGARHPRGRTDWPRVGILAQRAKARPNLLGVSCCQLLAVDGRLLHVKGLDAIDGSPVLDIKPYLKEFGPLGDVRQPAWSHALMRDYFRN